MHAASRWMMTTTSMPETLERAHEVGEVGRRDPLLGRVELRERPAAVAVEVLGCHVDRRRNLVALHSHEKEALVLAHDPPREQQDVLARPDDGAGINLEP